jgi:hypothetical protein
MSELRKLESLFTAIINVRRRFACRYLLSHSVSRYAQAQRRRTESQRIFFKSQQPAQSDDSNECQNSRVTTLADSLRLGEGGISASQSSDLLPTERVLLCKTPEGRRGAYMSARPGSIYGVRVTPSQLLWPVPFGRVFRLRKVRRGTLSQLAVRVESFLMYPFMLVQFATLIGTLPRQQCGSNSKTH